MTKPHDRQSRTPDVMKYSRGFTLLLCMGMLAGVLIWAKLRLVTDIPRSAYADPKEAELFHPEHGAEAGAQLIDDTAQELTSESLDDQDQELEPSLDDEISPNQFEVDG